MTTGNSHLGAKERADREYWRDNKRLIYVLLGRVGLRVAGV
jgi:hypothetical protein